MTTTKYMPETIRIEQTQYGPIRPEETDKKTRYTLSMTDSTGTTLDDFMTERFLESALSGNAEIHETTVTVSIYKSDTTYQLPADVLTVKRTLTLHNIEQVQTYTFIDTGSLPTELSSLPFIIVSNPLESDQLTLYFSPSENSNETFDVVKELLNERNINIETDIDNELSSIALDINSIRIATKETSSQPSLRVRSFPLQYS